MENDWFNYDRDKQEMEVHLSDKPPLKITKEDVQVSYFSGGPGGQNVNRSMQGVRLIYRIPDAHLHPYSKTRELVARSINERSQDQNFRQAFEDLAEKARRYFYMPPVRKQTKVPKRSKEQRLEGKKRRGQLKKDRKKVDF